MNNLKDPFTIHNQNNWYIEICEIDFFLCCHWLCLCNKQWSDDRAGHADWQTHSDIQITFNSHSHPKRHIHTHIYTYTHMIALYITHNMESTTTKYESIDAISFPLLLMYLYKWVRDATSCSSLLLSSLFSLQVCTVYNLILPRTHSIYKYSLFSIFSFSPFRFQRKRKAVQMEIRGCLHFFHWVLSFLSFFLSCTILFARTQALCQASQRRIPSLFGCY